MKNNMDKLKQSQMEKLAKLQSGDYSKIELNWKGMIIFIISVIIIVYIWNNI